MVQNLELLSSTDIADFIVRGTSNPQTEKVLAIPYSPNNHAGLRYYSPKELGILSERAAAYYSQKGLNVRAKGQEPRVVGIYARGTIEWAATFFAVLKMGHTVLVLSSRLSSDAIVALSEKANASMLIFGGDAGCLDSVKAKMVPIVPRDILEKPSDASTKSKFRGWVGNPEKDIAIISHSSGSTGLPKLFPATHATYIMQMNYATKKSTLNVEKSVIILSAMYNTLGMRVLIRCLMRTTPVFYDNDRLTYTPNTLTELVAEAKPETALLTPYSLELLAKTKKGMEMLKAFEIVQCFGAVIPQEVGDRLVQEGVYLTSEYGLTEGSQFMSSSLRPKTDMEWSWLMPTSATKPYLWMKPIEMGGTSEFSDQLYELIALKGCPGWAPTSSNSDDPPGSLRTGDLFLKHPTLEDRWKIIGRKDDQLKIYQNDRQTIVNAYVYEEAIKKGSENAVDDVILFGQGRDKLGVLVFTLLQHQSMKRSVEEQVWRSIQENVNGKFKVGIQKNMIVVISGGTIPRTTKLNFIRPQVYMKYKDLIDAAYGEKHINGNL